MTRRLKSIAVLVASFMALPVVSGVDVPTAAANRAWSDGGSYLVTTVGEFASVVRRDLGVWDTTRELTSHRFGGVFTQSELDRLAGDPRVSEITLNGIVRNNATQTDGPGGFAYPNDRLPWGLDRIDQRETSLSGSYTYANDGTGVTVYVVDSGVRATHQEFAGGRVQPGWSYRQNSTALSSYLAQPASARTCGPDAESFDANDTGLTDAQGHGTHVSATVVGATVGVAKDATVIPVRALDCAGTGTFVMVEEALKWIVNHHTSGPAVVNLSLGVSPSDDDPNPVSTAIRNQISALVAEGVPVVVAAGNDAVDSCFTMPVRYEATITGLIGVAASDWDDDEAYFSNWGSCVDVFAPGVRILSAYKTSDTAYAQLSGTSMAAPHVAGVVAQMLERTPSMTPAQIDAALTNTATRCAVARHDDYATFTPNRLVNTSGVDVSSSMPCAPKISGGTEGTRAVSVSWLAPTDTGNSAVTGYEVSTSPSSNGCLATAPTTTCTVTGLSAGQTYEFSVRATNAVGASRPSVAYTGMPLGVPDTPTLTGATVGLTTLTPAWAAALGDGNVYSVSATPNGGTCSATGTSCTISGLSPATTYTLTATLTNSRGTSLVSAPISATTGSLPAAPATPTATAGLNSALLSWSATVGATSYRVKNSSGAVVCATTQTSCLVAGLDGGTVQTFTVEGVNSFGATASQAVTATPDAQVGAVPGVKVTPRNASLLVSWSPAPGNNVTYIVSAIGTTARCVTTETSCTLPNLTNGRPYNVIVVGANNSSQSQSATAVSAYAGFDVKATRVKRSRRALLTSFVVPVSTAKRTWSERGSCRISGRFLISPSKKTTCTLVLRTARTKRLAATSITLRISVT